MPTTITLMSWNVESLGDAKATVGGLGLAQSEIVNLINLTVRKYGADVVGIMEVKSGRGRDLLGWLLARLNNVLGPVPYVWEGRVSARQDGGTQEEYLLLWKQQVGRLVLDNDAAGGPAAFAGVVDDNVMAPLFAQTGWNAVQRAQFYTALTAAGYVAPGVYRFRNKNRVTQTLRVVRTAWGALQAMPVPEVDFGAHPPPTPLTQAQLRWLARTLVALDIVRYVTYEDRSPFLGNFRVGANATPLLTALFHAPGPGDPTRMAAINNIAMLTPIRGAAAAGNLLVMGDFNITVGQMALAALDYERTQATGTWQFTPVTPRHLTAVFNPFVAAPPAGLGAADQMPGRRTALMNELLSDTAAPADALNNAYDKFFFRGAGGGVAAGATARNMVGVVAADQGAAYDGAVATSAMTHFRAFRGADFLEDRIDSMTRAQIKNGKLVARLQPQVLAAQAAVVAVGATPGSPLVTRFNTLTAELAKAQADAQWYSEQLTYLGDVKDVVEHLATPAPPDVQTAQVVYRHGVSDHLPITIDVTVP